MVRDFNAEATVIQITMSEEARQSLGANNLNKHDFKDLIDMNVILYNERARDKMGRPLLFMICRNLLFKDVTVDHLIRYVAYCTD